MISRISGFENYKITSEGKIMNSQGKEIIPFLNKGYFVVDLYKDGKRKHCRIHRLVAETFIPNPEILPQVNHKDGNKHNNNVENLEWCTCSENAKHAIEIGLRPKQPQVSGVQKPRRRKRRKGEFSRLLNLREKRIEKGFTQERLAQKAGVVRQTISNIECGTNKPSVKLAQKIAKILEFNWSEFFEGNE